MLARLWCLGHSSLDISPTGCSACCSSYSHTVCVFSLPVHKVQHDVPASHNTVCLPPNANPPLLLLCSFTSTPFLNRTETRTEASYGKRASSCCHIKYASSSCPRLFLTRRSFADGSRRPTTSHAMSCTQTTGKEKITFLLQVEAQQHPFCLPLRKDSLVELARSGHQ